MLFKSKLLTAGLLAGVAVLALGAGVWYFYLRSDAPPAVSLAGALDSLAVSTPEQSSATGATTAGEDTSAPAGDDELAGTWITVQSESSFVGYRVDETLGGIGATTAVGRTNDVNGRLHYSGAAITAVEITADLRTLTSDRSQRDGQLRRQAIETDTYPTATFVLTSPIAIGDVPAEGESVTQTVSGELTLHGVTRPIELEVEGVLQDGRLLVVGSTVIQFADYDIAQPVSMSVISIEDHGTLEFQLVFEQS